MRPIAYLIFIFLLNISCEDVIDVDIPTGQSRLIVDALTRVGVNDELIPFEIKVTTTNNFFEETPVTALESIVILVYTYDEEDVFVAVGSITLIEFEAGSGIYYPDPCCDGKNLTPTSILEFNVVFRLFIEHQGKKYYAETRYVPTVPIENIQQGDNILFTGEEQEVIVRFTDNPEKDNFYLFDFDFDEFLVTDDTFYQGQQYEFSYFYDRDFEANTQLNISILGSDETFYNYMNQLIEQSSAPQGPFQTPVSTVRGNIFDITGLDNIDIFDNVERPNDFPLGYFAIVQEFKSTITIE